MPLDFSSLSENINNTYVEMKTNLVENPTGKPSPKPPGTEWMDSYILNYDNDANNGVFSMASVVMSSLPNDLIFDTSTPVCGGPDKMGMKISDYWAAQTEMGEPQVGVSIASVVNDAAKIGPLIEAYLCSVVSEVSNPPYASLFEFIELQVKTIIWTVTELSPTGSPIVYPVTIS